MEKEKDNSSKIAIGFDVYEVTHVLQIDINVESSWSRRLNSYMTVLILDS